MFRRKNYMKNGELRQGDSLHFDGRGFYTKNHRSTRKTLMIMFVIWLAFTGAILLVNFVRAQNYETQQTQASRCPAGSYEIGERDGQPICKLEPTGCPYGDSIPLGPECDKHAESQKEGSPVWDRWEPEAPQQQTPTPSTGQPSCSAT